MTKQATGRASYKDGILSITTLAKRRKKVVEHTTCYLVQDARPDTRVADPAFVLTKGEIVSAATDMTAAALESGTSEEWQPTGEVYHVAMREFGPECDCAHATFRGHKSVVPCKHALSLIAVGLLPK